MTKINQYTQIWSKENQCTHIQHREIKAHKFNAKILTPIYSMQKHQCKYIQSKAIHNPIRLQIQSLECKAWISTHKDERFLALFWHSYLITDSKLWMQSAVLIQKDERFLKSKN